MKNIKKIIFTIFSFFIVSACSNVSVKEDLQENSWNFIQSDGVAGEIDFSNDLVVFSLKDFPMTNSYNYQLNENETEITMTKTETPAFSDEEVTTEIRYSIKKDDGEYILTLISDSSGGLEEGFTITLTPKKDNNSN